MAHQLELVPFRCVKCGRIITETVPSAEVYCPRCHRWNRYDKTREDG